MRATVTSCKPTFCHARTEDGVSVFVHQQEADFDMKGVLLNDIIEIESLAETPRGPRGYNATFVERAPAVDTPDEWFEGVVVHVDTVRMFAFARAKHQYVPGHFGRAPFDIMVHVSGAADYDGQSKLFARLARGMTISGTVKHTGRGRRLEHWS